MFQIEHVQRLIDELSDDREAVTVLEAGCGSSSRFTFSKATRVVEIDISKKQLDRNTVLTEKIVGDIQTYRLRPEGYDAIVSWDMLEHLKKPGLALASFARAVKVGTPVWYQ